jgi:hypothetical protein
MRGIPIPLRRAPDFRSFYALALDKVLRVVDGEDETTGGLGADRGCGERAPKTKGREGEQQSSRPSRRFKLKNTRVWE